MLVSLLYRRLRHDTSESFSRLARAMVCTANHDTSSVGMLFPVCIVLEE